MPRSLPLAASLFCWLLPLPSATIAPDYASSYSLVDLGPVDGLPTSYGGLAFLNPSTLLIGGEANSASGSFYTVEVTRGVDGHISGFGSTTALNFGAYNDGGVAYSPDGVLFYSRWPLNQIAQVKEGSTTDDKVTDLTPLGVASSHAALAFVPATHNGAGRLKLLSWSGGEFYEADLAPDGSGAYDILSATLTATLSGGPEGFVYVPLGSPLFPSQSMLVSDYSANRVSSYEIDMFGDPVTSSRKDFITGLNGAEGAVIDPLTGDFLFSTFGGGSRIVRVEGFSSPDPEPAPEPSSLTLALTAAAAYLLRRSFPSSTR